MDWTQIYNRALRLSNTNANDYTTAQASEDMNIRYQDMVDRIVSITKGDYFWDLGKTDTVVWQSEYVAEKLWISPDDLDIKKVNKVFIKYSSTDEYFTRVEYVSPNTLEQHPDYYKDNQQERNPFFYIQDTSVFIYPAPTEVVTWGIELFVIHKPEAIDTDSTEDDIEISAQFHSIIVLWLVAEIFYSQGKINEANDADAKYEEWIQGMVSFLKARYNQPKKKVITDLKNFR